MSFAWSLLAFISQLRGILSVFGPLSSQSASLRQ
jgi:hypothetical protein